jgi:TonB family protein
VLFQKPGPRPLRPSETAEELADTSQRLAAADVFVSDDALLDVNEYGERTNLNSRRFKYWDFFHRVRTQVKQQWRPNDVYRRRDPAWSIYQRQNRLTVLHVVLDDDGNVVNVKRARKSGLPFLDEEAVRAFTAAGPFLNPPRGLVDERGRIVFNFGFYLELNSGVGGTW